MLGEFSASLRNMQGFNSVFEARFFRFVKLAVDLTAEMQLGGPLETRFQFTDLLFNIALFFGESRLQNIAYPFYYLFFDTVGAHQPESV